MNEWWNSGSRVASSGAWTWHRCGQFLTLLRIPEVLEGRPSQPSSSLLTLCEPCRGQLGGRHQKFGESGQNWEQQVNHPPKAFEKAGLSLRFQETVRWHERQQVQWLQCISHSGLFSQGSLNTWETPPSRRAECSYMTRCLQGRPFQAPDRKLKIKILVVCKMSIKKQWIFINCLPSMTQQLQVTLQLKFKVLF